MTTRDFSFATWRKSSYSGQEGGNCVELADGAAVIGVRDSKNTHLPHLTIGCFSFRAVAVGIKRGDVDL
ncbi:DUF397 domain-containing protein [Actinocorallia sp. API 0066]|uniref:DUF397 domain-containing protein n=1 Tax=Actinocorallia sp. API 0066 TaxID=2896846 RepID=UPI001E6595E9|nr:DUF397 domain-containing protein [Actinocorallia sp. API 0066]MCD0447809.1 DUF397 domain-containing protein [Actinocorallia sp. API 0066]